MSGLESITLADVAKLTQQERGPYCVQLATALYTELGWNQSQRTIAQKLLPHFERLGLAKSLRQAQRYVKTAYDQFSAGFAPEDIEATREVLGLDARSGAMRLWAAMHAVCPTPAAIVEATGSVAREEVRADMRIACKLAEAAVKADAHVADLYALRQSPSDVEMLADPKKRELALDMFARIAPMLSDEDRELCRTALNASVSGMTRGNTPTLRLVREGSE